MKQTEAGAVLPEKVEEAVILSRALPRSPYPRQSHHLHDVHGRTSPWAPAHILYAPNTREGADF